MATRCKVCGGTNVQYAIWYSPNTGETHDVFGSWNAGDNTYCEDCETNTDLVDDELDYRDVESCEKCCTGHTSGPCCPGYLENAETGEIERCDDCGKYPDDDAARAAAEGKV